MQQTPRSRVQSPITLAAADALVPLRFVDAVVGHILANRLFPEVTPLILAIIGAPGTGKSWQVREVARKLSWHVVELNASSLAGEREGVVVSTLYEAYARAVLGLQRHSESFLLTDDFDLSMASIRGNVETSQHTQLLISALMELCDRPSAVRERFPKRAPIILTTNSLDAVYAPLIRYGRMHIFHWAPIPEELALIVERILAPLSCDVRKQLAQHYRDEGLAFFRELKSELLKQLIINRFSHDSSSAFAIAAHEIEDEFAQASFETLEMFGSKILASRARLNYLEN
jgi:AAA+ superfamily predicted ATPase